MGSSLGLFAVDGWSPSLHILPAFISVFHQLSHCIFLSLSNFFLSLFGSHCAICYPLSQPFIHFSAPVSPSMTLFLHLCGFISWDEFTLLQTLQVRLKGQAFGRPTCKVTVKPPKESFTVKGVTQLTKQRFCPSGQIHFIIHSYKFQRIGCHCACGPLQLDFFCSAPCNNINV